jgi:hypothetical protein
MAKIIGGWINLYNKGFRNTRGSREVKSKV